MPEIKVKVPKIAYAHVTFDPVEKNGKQNAIINTILKTVFITLKILFTRPVSSFGIRLKRYDTRNILDPEFVKPITREII